jgi:aryl-alcohol dehydrogenase-like predicted oxidoreductase
MGVVELAPGYFIPRIIVGCWQLAKGHGKEVNPDRIIQKLFVYASRGMTTFDCADIYIGVEELLGMFRKTYGSQYGCEALNKLKIHTKFVPNRSELSEINRTSVERAIDLSLRRLGVEQIDLVQFHWWDFNVPRYVEVAHYLSSLKSKGKIVNLGVTNFDVSHLRELVENGIPVISNQVQYSLLDQRPERSMVDFAFIHGIKLLCYGTLAGGFFSEKFLGANEPYAQFKNRSLTKYKLLIDDFGGWELLQELLFALNKIAERHEVTIADIAQRFVLEKPAVAGIIVGFRHGSSYCYPASSTFSFVLSEHDRREIQEVLWKSLSLPGDIYSLERMQAGKHGKIMKYDLNFS